MLNGIYSKIGIVFAMEEELIALTQHLPLPKSLKIGYYTVLHIVYKQKHLYLINAGIGKVNAAIATALLIKEYQTDLIVNIGIAGSVAKKLSTGDVLISDASVYYDVDATVFDYQHGQVPRMPTHYQSSLSASLEPAQFDFKIMPGIICTGDSFLSSLHRLNKIKKLFPDILAVDMEGAAIAQACYQFQVPFLMIKGISDQVNKASSKDSEKNIQLAMEHAAKVFLGIIKSL